MFIFSNDPSIIVKKVQFQTPLYGYLFTIVYQSYKNKRCRLGFGLFWGFIIGPLMRSEILSYYLLFLSFLSRKLYFQDQENKCKQFKIKYI